MSTLHKATMSLPLIYKSKFLSNDATLMQSIGDILFLFASQVQNLSFSL